MRPVGDQPRRVEGTVALRELSAGAGGLAVIGEDLAQQRYREARRELVALGHGLAPELFQDVAEPLRIAVVTWL
jgi:hypothetical protein